MKLKTIFITSLLLAFLFTYGQKPPSKFGKISPEEFETTVCPIDSNAHAYFIFDFGYTDFRYASTRVRENDPSSGRKGFQMFFEHHYRIKILDNNAFDLADIEIPIYHDNRDNREEITKFRAVTYNRVGKKIEGSRLRQNDLITEEASENWDVMKCAMPDVKAGSIIEVEYIVKSDFLYNMQGWEFQHTIPILHSEYLVTIPEYFYYNQSQRGYYQVNMETEAKSNSITITYHNVDNSVNNFSFNTGRSKSTRTIDFEETVYHYFAKNIPAFPIEKYLTTPKNYLSKVDFELAWIKYPGQIEERYTESWDDINHKLLNSGNFGLQLKRERFLKNEVEQLKALNMDTLALIEAAFTTIKNKITWNGQYRKYASDNLRDAYKSGAGNTADINLTLVVLLNELGLEAYPVLISTRKNGMIHPSHPSLSSFNYVIALARIGNDNYLMDATEPLSEINLLPTRCLNNQGWLVDENKSGWIDLQNGKLEKSATYNLTLDEDGKFKGAVDYTYTNYGAFEERLKASDNSDTESYLKEKFKDLRGLTITESSVTGIDTLYNDVKTHLDLEISGHLENAGDLYFFEPLFLDRVEENPFKIEDREYPVEFEYPVCEMQSVSITIPDDYIVEELPKPMIVNLDDKSARFIYNINQLGNKIVITSIFSINKVLFLPEQYPYLKQLLDMVVDKHKEQVVLKKI